MKEGFDKKKIRMLKEMEIKNLEWTKKPPVRPGIDLAQVKYLQSIISGKVKAGSRFEAKLAAYKALNEPEKKAYLFFYSVYTFIEGEGFETLTEDQAKDKLTDLPDMEVYFCKLTGSTERPPSIMQDRKGLHTETVTGHEGLSDLIFRKTQVRVPESDLMVKTPAQLKGKVDLNEAKRIIIKNKSKLIGG